MKALNVKLILFGVLLFTGPAQAVDISWNHLINESSREALKTHQKILAETAVPEAAQAFDKKFRQIPEENSSEPEFKLVMHDRAETQ